MDIKTIIDAIVLGIVEGVTEFIPVSSTAHLLLSAKLLGFVSPGGVFEVLIQLGAILALLSVYAARLWQIVTDLPLDPRTRRFVVGVLIAFLPAAILGVALHSVITGVFFRSLTLISLALLIGGVILLLLDRMPLRPRYTRIMDYPLGLCLGIGVFQCLALIPGVSRSGATIAGALVLGTDKRSAAEYSFFLAMPTMAGAFAYDLYKNIGNIDRSAGLVIALGFIVAFISALVVVRGFLGFVARHGFAPFAWWRIAVGAIGLIAVLFLNGNLADQAAASGRAAAVELAMGAEAVQVGGQDSGERVRLDAEGAERAALGLRRF